MDSPFLKSNGNFETWSFEHILVLIVLLIIGIGLIRFSRKYLNHSQQAYLISFLTILIAWSQISRVYIRLYLDIFDVSEDLPFHLCNIMPFILPFALFLKNERFWAVCYFFIMAGTAQSLVTPTLTESAPNYEFWRYWIVHGGLVIAVLYPIFLWKFKPVLKDVFVAWWSINVLGFLMMAISIPLEANYMYMLGHPEGNTIYNLLGEWPWYIFSMQLLALVLFALLYLPFRKRERDQGNHSKP